MFASVKSRRCGAETTGVRRCMELLKLPRGYVVCPARRDYALGHGIRALAADALLERVVGMVSPHDPRPTT